MNMAPSNLKPPRAYGPGWAAFADIRRQHLPLYREAADRVRLQFGSVDGLLYRGGLESIGAEHALSAATGEATRGAHPWGILYVRGLKNKAVWPEVMGWAPASAKAFLDVSAEIGSSIHFTY